MLDKLSRLDRSKTELHEKTTELSDLKSENCRLEEQLNASNQLVRNLEEQQRMSAALLNEQKASLTAANEEKLRLENAVCEYKEKTELLTAENQELEKSLDQLEAQHQDVVEQLITSRDDLAANNRELSLLVAAQSEASDMNRIENKELERAEPLLSGSSSLPSETVRGSASDAANVIKAVECTQFDCDAVSSHAMTEQCSDTAGELKACRAELQHLQLTVEEREKFYNDHIARLSAEVQSSLSAKSAESGDCSSKDRLIDELSARIRSFEDEQQQLVGDLESCRGKSVEEKRAYEVEIAQLCHQIEELTAKLRHADEQPAMCPSADSQADEVTAALRAEIKSLKENLDEKESVCQLYESEVERLTTVEHQLTKEIERQQEVISKSPQRVVSVLSTDVVDEISVLRDQLSVRERELKEKVEETCRLRQTVEEMSAELEQLRQKLIISTAANGSARPCSNHEVCNGNQTSEVDLSMVVETSTNEICSGEAPNADTCRQSRSRVLDDSKEIAELRSTVSRQKDMLDALNSKYASLRGLLEHRSQAQHGSSVLSDVHRLELELRDIRADRERLLTVLGEKTREASGLRAEVHRLTSVAAASQAALTKAQQDAQQIASRSQQETNQDMKNEAVKKLSQIIKDKDVEIGALQLKNATLVQV